MNNSELADRIATEHQLSKPDARKVVDAVFAAIADAALEQPCSQMNNSSLSVVSRDDQAGLHPIDERICQNKFITADHATN